MLSVLSTMLVCNSSSGEHRETSRGKASAFHGGEEQMRVGYFKVDETSAHATLIFPGPFVGGTPVVELRHWLDHRGIFDPIVYRPAAVVVPITENGVSA
jgi:hypothetical protein